MNMLDRADNVFRIRFEVIYGGSGFFLGVLDEPNQQPPPAYIFSAARRTLRVDPKCGVRAGMVIRSPMGEILMVGQGGSSEQMGGTFQGFRLFEATHQMLWARRHKTLDPITNLERDDGVDELGMIWCSYEPDSKEASGGALKTSIETARLITAAPVQRDDLLGEYRVTRADTLLGLQICNVG